MDTNLLTGSTGALVVLGGVSVNKSLYIGGNENIVGNLGVTGNTNINGNLGVTGYVGIYSVLDTNLLTGNTGALTVSGGASIGKSLYVGGNENIVGNLGVTGNVNVAGTLGVTGDTTLYGNLIVNGTITNNNAPITPSLIYYTPTPGMSIPSNINTRIQYNSENSIMELNYNTNNINISLQLGGIFLYTGATQNLYNFSVSIGFTPSNHTSGAYALYAQLDNNYIIARSVAGGNTDYTYLSISFNTMMMNGVHNPQSYDNSYIRLFAWTNIDGISVRDGSLIITKLA